MQPSSVADGGDLRAYLQILNRRRITTGLVAIVILGLALGYSFATKPAYTASAQVLLPSQAITSSPALGNTGQQQVQASQQSVLADAQQFAQGDATKKIAAASLHFVPKVTVTASTTADVLTFSTVSGSPSQAATTANTYVAAFIFALRQSQVDQYTQQVSALQTSVAKIRASESGLATGSTQLVADQQSITTLTQTIQTLQAQLQLTTESGPTVLQSAVPPTAPSSPKPLRDGILGLVAGLVIGLGAAFVKEHLDDKVGSLVDVEHHAGGLPVLGTIPVVGAWRNQKQSHLALVEDSSSPVSEAYRTCRTAVQFIGIDQPHRVVSITSSTPGEGKTTTAANLAVSFARSGSKVIVVSCDFRRPRLHEFFGLDNRIGMTSVLLGQATLSKAIRPVEGEGDLRVLTSGPVPPNPAEILSLDRVRKLIDVLAANADIVIVDCPPVLPVTDTLLVSRLVDGMVVLAVAGKTKKHDLQRSIELLRQVDAPLFGTLVNKVPLSGAYAGGYGYGYGAYRYESKLPADVDDLPVDKANQGIVVRGTRRSRGTSELASAGRQTDELEMVDLSEFDLDIRGDDRTPSRNGGTHPVSSQLRRESPPPER